MRLKLDENLGVRGATLLRSAGHDVATIPEQGMSAAPDSAVIAACSGERRCLITLDLDFANPIRFAPESHSGVAVLRPAGPATTVELNDLLTTLAEALSTNSIQGKLWIVEHGRIREYVPE